MKKIILILESGEELLVGYSSSLYVFLMEALQIKVVPLHGNREYVFIKNIYDYQREQFVSFKALKNVPA